MKTNFVNFHMLYNKLSLGFVKENSKKNFSIENTYINNELLDIISNDFNTKDALHTLFKYIDRLLRVYMNKETIDNVLNELNKVNELFNLLDKNVLHISTETLEFIHKREEMRRNEKGKTI